jgi:hypothetical protein
MSPLLLDTATTLAQARWRGTGDTTHQGGLGCCETTRMGADRDHQTCSDTTRPSATTVAVFLARTIWPQAGPLCPRGERLSRAHWDQQSDDARPANRDGDP